MGREKTKGKLKKVDREKKNKERSPSHDQRVNELVENGEGGGEGKVHSFLVRVGFLFLTKTESRDRQIRREESWGFPADK